MSRKSAAVGVIAFAALLFVLGVLVSKGAPPTPTEDAEFHGKVVLVVLKTDRGSNLLLQNVHVKRLGDRPFLVGTYLSPTERDKYPEADQWIALDQLLGLTVYSSKDDARKSAAEAAKQSKE